MTCRGCGRRVRRDDTIAGLCESCDELRDELAEAERLARYYRRRADHLRARIEARTARAGASATA
jgi:NMD protein affecting ribosome stability and mRNA decay